MFSMLTPTVFICFPCWRSLCSYVFHVDAHCVVNTSGRYEERQRVVSCRLWIKLVPVQPVSERAGKRLRIFLIRDWDTVFDKEVAILWAGWRSSLKWFSSLHIWMQGSFWWDSVELGVVSLFPHLPGSLCVRACVRTCVLLWTGIFINVL